MNYWQQLCASWPEIDAQFRPRSGKKSQNFDPLEEDKHSPLRGLVHKYDNRVLLFLTNRCPVACAFCTRQRITHSQAWQIKDKDLLLIFQYIRQHPHIQEIIFSGGDPLLAIPLLGKSLDICQKMSQIKVIRIHTRLPVIKPKVVNDKLLGLLKSPSQIVYLSLHINHPAEITEDLSIAVKKLRLAGIIMLGQTVFLRGINDCDDVLAELFEKMVTLGIRPYYIHHIDPVPIATGFAVDSQQEIALMSKLRKRLSGIAWPCHVIDLPGGVGKVPMPTDFWHCDYTQVKDFNGKIIKI